MPKKQIFGTILILVILSFICIYIYNNYKVESTTKLIANNNNECKNELVEYYKTDKETYYLYCLNDVVVDYTDRTLELNKAMAARQMDKENLLKLVSKKYTLNDGKINYYQNDELGILECIFDDKINYIIGTSIEYKEGMCDEFPYLSMFTKNYIVLDVSKSKSNYMTYLTLKDNELDEVSTISINSEYDFVEDTEYAFKFGKYKDIIGNSIKDIFEENILLGVEKVDLNLEDNILQANGEIGIKAE